MRKGFTLVELSIVLVVIGLLIGGVLVAQSMIETAKISTQINQFQQYDIAVSQFRNKYDQLPGDSTLFSSTGAAGNNNGNIEGGDYYGGASSTWGGPSEAANFWRHLSESSSISEAWGTATHDNVRAGIDAPAAKLGAKGSLIQGMSLRTAGYSVNIPWGEYWMLCLNGGTGSPGRFCAGNHMAGGALTGIQALALDTKMDDGLPGSGIVFAGGSAGAIPQDAGGNYGIGCVTGDALANPTSAHYLLHISAPDWWTGNDSTPLCNLHVKMFGLVGGER